MLTNDGTLRADIFLNNAGGTFTNSGSAGVLHRNFITGGCFITGGFDTLTNDGTLTNNAGGTLASDNLTNDASGTLTNAGGLGGCAFTNSGFFVEEIGGAGLGDFGELFADNIALGGLLDVVLLNGFTPASGDSFDFIAFFGGRTGAFASEIFPALPAGLSWTLTYEDNLGHVELEVTGSTGSAPEPSTLLLLAAGIAGLLLSVPVRLTKSESDRARTAAQ
jgi:hypothetical protein